MRQMRTKLGAGERWLRGLDSAATAHNMTVQLCGAGPSDLLLSTNLPSITQARASMDYDLEFNPPWHSVNGLHNVMSADSGWLFWATGISPSKDSLWTTNSNLQEMRAAGFVNDSTFVGRDCELQIVAALMSTSCLGIGDWKATNATLLRKVAMQNGILLQPDRPMVPLDAMFSARDGWWLSSNNTSQWDAGARLWGTHASVGIEAADAPERMVGRTTRQLVSHSGVDEARRLSAPQAVQPGALLSWSIVAVDLLPGTHFLLGRADLYPHPRPWNSMLYARPATGNWAPCVVGQDPIRSGCLLGLNDTDRYQFLLHSSSFIFFLFRPFITIRFSLTYL